MLMFFLQLLWIQIFPPNVFSASASHALPPGTTLLENNKWQMVGRRRDFEVDDAFRQEATHLHRVDGLDPFASHRRFEHQSWLQQGYSAFAGNGTCRPFGDVRKTMEELHARAKETLLELIAALGRMQAQTQLEKSSIDNLVEAQKASQGALKNCEQQKSAAAKNAEKYNKELQELQQIGQADAQIFNISQTFKTSLIRETVPAGAINVPTSLLQRESRDMKRLGAMEDADRPFISLAGAYEGHSHEATSGNVMSKTLYKNVQEAAKELKDCLAQTKQDRVSASPTESPEKCASHKERLKKMFAAAYAHIARIKEKYEDLADDDSCDKAAAEEFGAREGQLKEQLNATRRHLCSVHKTMTDLTQDAKDLVAQANATDKLLQKMGATPPDCSENGWSDYYHVILDVTSLIENHPACTKCCETQSTESLLQIAEKEEAVTSDNIEAWHQEEPSNDNIVSQYPLHMNRHYWSL